MPGPSTAEALQTLYSTLINDAGITALVPVNQIVNHRPQVKNGFADNPAILYRVGSAIDWDTKDSNGFEMRFEIDIWTKQHGDIELHQIMDAIYLALHNIPLVGVITGQSLILRCREMRILDNDGISHHGFMQFTHIFTQ